MILSENKDLTFFCNGPYKIIIRSGRAQIINIWKNQYKSHLSFFLFF